MDLIGRHRQVFYNLTHLWNIRKIDWDNIWKNWKLVLAFTLTETEHIFNIESTDITLKVFLMNQLQTAMIYLLFKVQKPFKMLFGKLNKNWCELALYKTVYNICPKFTSLNTLDISLYLTYKYHQSLMTIFA